MQMYSNSLCKIVPNGLTEVTTMWHYRNLIIIIIFICALAAAQCIMISPVCGFVRLFMGLLPQ